MSQPDKDGDIRYRWGCFSPSGYEIFAAGNCKTYEELVIYAERYGDELRMVPVDENSLIEVNRSIFVKPEHLMSYDSDGEDTPTICGKFRAAKELLSQLKGE